MKGGASIQDRVEQTTGAAKRKVIKSWAACAPFVLLELMGLADWGEALPQSVESCQTLVGRPHALFRTPYSPAAPYQTALRWAEPRAHQKSASWHHTQLSCWDGLGTLAGLQH